MNLRILRSSLIALASAVALNFSMPALAQEQGDDQVIATVEGEKITKQDFTLAYSSLPPRVRQLGIDTLYPHVLEMLIQQVLIVKRGRDANLAQDPDIQRRLKIAEDRLIYRAYLTGEIQQRLTDEVLRAEYDRFLEANPPREEVRARHILVESEAEAKEIIKLIGEGQPFADLAQTRSKGPSGQNGGDLGYFGRGKMVPEFEQIAFALEPNTYSVDPVKTQFGWHVIMVEDTRTMEPPTFEQLRPRLTNAVGQAMADGVMKEIVDSANIERFNLDGNPIEAPEELLPELRSLQQ